MKTYRIPLILGLVLSLLFGAAGLAGYGVVVYYGWVFLLVFIFLIALPIIKRKPSITAYLSCAVILFAFSIGGAFVGHWGRQLQCRSRSKACEPILALLQQHRDEYGQYPLRLLEVQGFERAQRDAGLVVAQGEFSEYGIDLDGINTHDALIFLGTNFVSCVVPVTKLLPMSFTRLYVYRWNNDDPFWKYDKLVWTLGQMN